MRKEFDDAGVRVAIVSGTDLGAKEFVEAVWKEGELFVDEEEVFKRALGGEKYKNWWILKPWVLSQMRSLARSGGAEFNDVSHEKTQLLGGTLIIKGGNVIHEYHETRSFDNGNARDLLNAVLGKSTPATPLQAEACEQ